MGYQSENGRLARLTIMVILLGLLLISRNECGGQTLSVGYAPQKSGGGIMLKKGTLVAFTDIGTYKVANESLTAWKYGIGISINEPCIVGKWDNATLDVILCSNHYFNDNTYVLINKDKLRRFSIELGTQLLLTNKVVATFHYDIINFEGRMGIGIKLNTRHDKSNNRSVLRTKNNGRHHRFQKKRYSPKIRRNAFIFQKV